MSTNRQQVRGQRATRSISVWPTASILILSWGSVGLALILQHRFGMQPCAWCTIQRVIYLALGAIAALALIPWRPLRALSALLAGLVALSGVAAALYQQFVAAKSASCGFSWADQLMFEYGLDESFPALFKATAPCNEANVPLLGVPFAIWSALLFALLALLALYVLRQTVSRPR